MTVAIIRTFILYVIVIFSVRFMGKRQIGQMQPTELVITILISNIATLSLEDPDCRCPPEKSLPPSAMR